MRRAWLAICVLASGCGATVAPIVDAGSFDAGASLSGNELVDAHNAVRAAAMPAPSPALEPVTWSESAAAIAAAWADNCQFMHNAGRGKLGENIFAGSGATWTGTKVVTSWASEKSDFDLATNTCASGKVCGHYTQIVWRSSVQIGCASKQCTTNNPFGGSGAWTLWVCNYAPPGNVLGSKPY